MKFNIPLSKIVKLSNFFESCMNGSVALFCISMLYDRDSCSIFLLGYTGGGGGGSSSIEGKEFHSPKFVGQFCFIFAWLPKC